MPAMPRSPRLIGVTVVASGAMLLASCGVELAANTGQDVTDVPQPATRIAATTNLDANGSLPPGKRVQFVANDPWLIESVTVDGASGQANAGIAEPVIRWNSSPLEPTQRATYTAQLRDQASGETQTITRSVVTSEATNKFSATVFPKSGTWGVGVMPTVTFDRYVPRRDRSALEARLKVVTTPTEIAGSWRWEEDNTAVFRPKGFWPAKALVTVRAEIRNAVIRGNTGSSNSYGSADRSGSFTTDKGMVIYVSGPGKSGRVTIGGKTVRKFGTSVGKAGYITRSGIKTITEKLRVTRMTNIGVTDDEVYDLQVPYAMRITDTGEFLHGAPWNGNIGYANTSHGCTNLKLSDAAWIFERANWGTPVVTTGTSRSMETWNGPGARWNVAYKNWSNA